MILEPICSIESFQFLPESCKVIKILKSAATFEVEQQNVLLFDMWSFYEEGRRNDRNSFGKLHFLSYTFFTPSFYVQCIFSRPRFFGNWLSIIGRMLPFSLWSHFCLVSVTIGMSNSLPVSKSPAWIPGRQFVSLNRLTIWGFLSRDSVLEWLARKGQK